MLNLRIEKLRGVAILGVLAYHLKLPLPGGYLGVDIFFVISGFLVYGKIYDQLNTNEFKVMLFIKHRIFRVYPILLVCLLASTFVGIFILSPLGELQNLSKSGIFSLFFLSNYFFMQNIGNYFDPYASTLPTLHFWSLSIEFQVWLLFIFLGKLLQTKYLRKNSTVMFFLLAPIILFTLFIIERRIFKQIDIDTFVFYSTSIRGLELLLGAGIFVFFKRKIYSFQLTLDQNVLMILMLVLMLIDFNKSIYLQITILALTSLLLMQCNPDQFAQTDTLAKIGGYAYIVYLLHWPTIVYLNRFIENRYILTGLVLLLLILVCPQLKNIETFYIKISKQK